MPGSRTCCWPSPGPWARAWPWSRPSTRAASPSRSPPPWGSTRRRRRPSTTPWRAGLAGRTLAEGAELEMEGEALAEVLPTVPGTAGLSHALALPVRARDRALGVVWAADEGTLHDDPVRRHAARSAVERIGFLLEQARLYEALERVMAQILATDERLLGRIGLDIHDGPTQALSVSLLELQLMEADLADAESAGMQAAGRPAPGVSAASTRPSEGRCTRCASSSATCAPPSSRTAACRTSSEDAVTAFEARSGRGGRVRQRRRVPGGRRLDHPADHLLPHPPGDADQRASPRPGDPGAACGLIEATGGVTPGGGRQRRGLRPGRRAAAAGPDMPQARFGALRDARPGPDPGRLVRRSAARRARAPSVRVFLPRWSRGPCPRCPSMWPEAPARVKVCGLTRPDEAAACARARRLGGRGGASPPRARGGWTRDARRVRSRGPAADDGAGGRLRRRGARPRWPRWPARAGSRTSRCTARRPGRGPRAPAGCR